MPPSRPRRSALRAVVMAATVVLSAAGDIFGNLASNDTKPWPVFDSLHGHYWLSLAAVTAILAVLAVHEILRARSRSTDGGQPLSGDLLREAGDLLAARTLQTWSDECRRRKISTPVPIRVAWRYGPPALSLPRLDVLTAPVRGDGPTRIPNALPPERPSARFQLGAVGVLDAGVVTELHDVYANLPRGCLVLVGGPGTGKTAAMLLLLLAALEHRRTIAAPEQHQIPVPVWLSMSGWNPQAQPLAGWIRATLARDHPAVRAFGPGLVDDLLRERRLALFLDGLDELPPALRGPALQAVQSQALGLRVVLSSRSEEYEAALADGRLEAPAVLELQPVDAARAGEYLRQGHVQADRPTWVRLSERLRAAPGSTAAQTLSTPLMLSLVRDAYQHSDPVELLDEQRFGNEREIRAHLIDRTLQVAYPNPKVAARSLRQLGWIAHRMGTARDLQWWQIPSWSSRTATVAAATVVTTAVTLAVTVGVELVRTGTSSSASQLRTLNEVDEIFDIGWVSACIYGILAGLLAGLRIANDSDAQPLSLLRSRPPLPDLAAFVDRQISESVEAYRLRDNLAWWFAIWYFFVVASLMYNSIYFPNGRFAHWPWLDLTFALIFGLFVTSFMGLISRTLTIVRRLMTSPSISDPSLSPTMSFRQDQRASVVLTVLFGGAIASVDIVIADWPSLAVALYVYGVPIVIGCALGYGGPSTRAVMLAPVLRLLDGRPVRIMRFLGAAHERDLLRQSGASYQFRHAELQDHLARDYRARAGIAEPAPEPPPAQEPSPHRPARWQASGRLPVWVTSLAFVERGLALAGNDRHVHVLSPEHRLLAQLTPHPAIVEALSSTPDGQKLAAGDRKGIVLVWNCGDPEPILRFKARTTVSSVSFSPDQRMLAVGGSSGRVLLHSTLDGSGLRRLRAGRTVWARTLNTVAFSPSGDTLCAAGNFRAVMVWDVAHQYRRRHLRAGRRTTVINAMAYSCDGSLLAAAYGDRRIRIWAPTTGALVRTVPTSPGLARALVFLPGGTILAGGVERTVQLIDVDTGDVVASFAGHAATVTALAVSPDGVALASADREGVVLRWELSGVL